MRFFRRLKMDKVAWPLRRLYCPVKKNDLVLEVGSGGNPYYRANILCDAYLETQERHFEKLMIDRPIILALVENLPFKDNTFDFVIASHVLEHSKNPEKFISELQRVAKAGYIEVPDAFMERLTNYPFHMLEITDKNGELVIRKKKGPVQDEELWSIFKNKAQGIAPILFSKKPFNFHARYYWSKDSGGIKYKILNPEYKFDWEPPAEPLTHIEGKISLKTRINKIILFIFRKLFSQTRRNKNLGASLDKYLICLNCKGSVANQGESLVCENCGKLYPSVNGNIPNFVL